MAEPKRILIDTNVIINLEDHKEIGKQYAVLNRICSQHGIALLAHQSSQDDVLRDKDEARRKISLSKLEKYPKIHKTPQTTAEKEAAFGKINSPNDEVDTDLLVSIKLDTADLLVTDDKGLIARVKGTALADKVLNLPDAVAKLQGLFGVVSADFKHVQDKFCNQFKLDDPFFNSLIQDYPEFRDWYQGCMAKQRTCWVIHQQSGIGGMIIYKSESVNDPKELKELRELGIPGDKVLKLCLFKMDESMKGEKFGEQLLKKAMDYAYRNGFDTAYLTVFSKHPTLIGLVRKFGFFKCGSKGDGSNPLGLEEVYVKRTKVVDLGHELSGFEFHKTFWPCVKAKKVKKYFVPIKPEFHDRLFPDAAKRFAPSQLQLFDDGLPKTPGNAIRKAYVSNSVTTSIEPGSVLLFYRSGDSVITSVGVSESYEIADSLEKLKASVGSRSVYTDDELRSMTGSATPAKALNFYYAKDLKMPIPLAKLRDMGLSQPQSIAQMPDEKFDKIFAIFDDEDKGFFYD